jgi:hypothetical protein
MSSSSRRDVLVLLGLLGAVGSAAAQNKEAAAPQKEIAAPQKETKEAKPMPGKSRIALKCTADGDTFARYVPFGDQREVIVRRGKEMGFNYGSEKSRRMVTIKGHKFPLVRTQAILSPPPMHPGQKPMSKEAAKNYKPESEVLYLPDAEVLIRREPQGFSSAEVEKILAAISFE